jgi:uncharacterized protein (DUF4415 family)
MNTKKTKEVDYEKLMRDYQLEPSEIKRGAKEREKRREAAKKRITIRIDEEILDQFKLISPEGRGYQSLINLALREWLTAQGVKELVNDKISQIVDQAVASLQDLVGSARH